MARKLDKKFTYILRSRLCLSPEKMPDRALKIRLGCCKSKIRVRAFKSESRLVPSLI